MAFDFFVGFEWRAKGSFSWFLQYLRIRITHAFSVNFIVNSHPFGVNPGLNVLSIVKTAGYTPEVYHSPWKMVVGRLLSYWEGNFSGAMLNFGRVFMIGHCFIQWMLLLINHMMPGSSLLVRKDIWHSVIVGGYVLTCNFAQSFPTCLKHGWTSCFHTLCPKKIASFSYARHVSAPSFRVRKVRNAPQTLCGAQHPGPWRRGSRIACWHYVWRCDGLGFFQGWERLLGEEDLFITTTGSHNLHV